MRIARMAHATVTMAMRVTHTQAVQRKIRVMVSPAVRMLIAQTDHVFAIQAMKATLITDVRQFVYQEVARLVQDKQAHVAVLKFKHHLAKTARVLCIILAEQRPVKNRVKKIVTEPVLKKRRVAEGVRAAKNVKMEPVLKKIRAMM